MVPVINIYIVKWNIFWQFR